MSAGALADIFIKSPARGRNCSASLGINSRLDHGILSHDRFDHEDAQNVV
jgi:hypothetical protein